jgi:predicted HTH transcriptional regulator
MSYKCPIKAVKYVKEIGKLTNNEYQKICNINKRHAMNDLNLPENKNVFKRAGVTGRGTHCVLAM